MTKCAFKIEIWYFNLVLLSNTTSLEWFHILLLATWIMDQTHSSYKSIHCRHIDWILQMNLSLVKLVKVHSSLYLREEIYMNWKATGTTFEEQNKDRCSHPHPLFPVSRLMLKVCMQVHWDVPAKWKDEWCVPGSLAPGSRALMASVRDHTSLFRLLLSL